MNCSVAMTKQILFSVSQSILGRLAVATAIFPSGNETTEQAAVTSPGISLKILHWGGLEGIQGLNNRN